MKHPLLIGNDTLRNNKMIINYENKTVVLNKKLIPFYEVQDTTKPIRVMQYTFVPPRSNWHVPVKIGNNKHRKNNELYAITQIEESPYFCGDPNKHITPAVISNRSKTSWVAVVNNSGSPIYLKKNSDIAIAQVLNTQDIIERDIENNFFDPDGGETTPILNNMENENHKKSLLELIDEYKGIFAASDRELTQTSLLEAKIETGDAAPRRAGYYRTPMHLKKVIDKQIEDLLEAKIIEKSTSSWLAPIVMIKKADGSYRMCVDYRKLNEVTKPYNFVIPQMNDIFSRLGNKTYFSSLDARSGFFSIPLHIDSK